MSKVEQPIGVCPDQFEHMLLAAMADLAPSVEG
jgi:hypothetical protein